MAGRPISHCFFLPLLWPQIIASSSSSLSSSSTVSLSAQSLISRPSDCNYLEHKIVDKNSNIRKCISQKCLDSCLFAWFWSDLPSAWWVFFVYPEIWRSLLWCFFFTYTLSFEGPWHGKLYFSVNSFEGQWHSEFSFPTLRFGGLWLGGFSLLTLNFEGLWPWHFQSRGLI